mmetsp:Transcript_20264/g.48252  ORF Transcript_20264/g.48252 Transcript_20264/m.48252 type:complete len:257 (+) Transcript_20264:925-1695(+)
MPFKQLHSFDEDFDGDLKGLESCYKPWRLNLKQHRKLRSSEGSQSPTATSQDHPQIGSNSKDITEEESVLAAPSDTTILSTLDTTNQQNQPDPLTYQAATSGPDASQWIEAIKEELGAHVARRTWVAAMLPAGRKAIGAKWVFKTKPGHAGVPERKKARLVCKGFSQTYGIDYEETFAPTVSKTTIRAVFSFAAHEDWVIEQADVNTAFLKHEKGQVAGILLIYVDDILIFFLKSLRLNRYSSTLKWSTADLQQLQ